MVSAGLGVSGLWLVGDMGNSGVVVMGALQSVPLLRVTPVPTDRASMRVPASPVKQRGLRAKHHCSTLFYTLNGSNVAPRLLVTSSL